MKAVIMAGGKGTRLRPLTCDKPKPMVPIVNRPMMEHIVRLLVRHGFREVAVTMCYLPEVITAYFQDGSRFGVNCRYYLEETPLGTAGSVKNAAAFLDDTFLVISGDALTDINLGEALAFHRRQGAMATLVLTTVDTPLEYGVVIVDEEGRVKRFLEKPSWGEVFSDTVNTGIYFLEPEVLQYFGRGEVFDFSRDLFPLLLAKGAPLYGYVARGYWSDIGNLTQYRQAHYDALAGKVSLSLPGRCERPGIWIEEGARVDPEAKLEGPVVLGAYSQVKKGAHLGPYTVLGPYVEVSEGASLKRSILWQNIFLDKQVEVRGAIVCDHSRLRAGAAVYEGAVIGEECALGHHSVVKPEVKLWPGKMVDNQVTVGSSLVWGTRWSRALFGNLGVSGVANVDITPEVAAKLGAAYGASLKPGVWVTVSADHHRPSRMLKRALTAGILSAGVNVYDLGTQTTPLARFVVAASSVEGGIHVRCSPQDENATLLEFLDEKGLNLSKAAERNLENILFREDFRRSGPQELGGLAFLPQAQARYLEELLALVDVHKIAAANLSLVTAAAGEVVPPLLHSLLERLGCRYQTLPFPDEGDTEDKTSWFPLQKELAAALPAAGAHLGAALDQNGERLLLVERSGRVVGEEMLLTLLALLALRKGERTLPVPVTAPGAIEKLATAYQGRVVRTKADTRAWLEKWLETRTTKGEAPHLFPGVDALASLVQILELVAVEGSLARVLAEIPPFYRTKQEVPCAWEDKGRVMRELFVQTQVQETEVLDGIKVTREEGWALVLPDAEEPVFRIYSEAGSQEEADALAMTMATQIYAHAHQAELPS